MSILYQTLSLMLAFIIPLVKITNMGSVKEIQNWFKSHIEDDGKAYTLDKHQAAIIIDSHKNTIVTARAGSGKTRTIVAKIAYLIAHEHLKPEEIVVFAFNKKAKTEINERLTKITYNKTPLFKQSPSLATTFHAFAYQILGGRKVLSDKIIDETEEASIIGIALQKHLPIEITKDQRAFKKSEAIAKQFIIRAEQKYFKNYSVLEEKITSEQNIENKKTLTLLFAVLEEYHRELRRRNKINFNQMITLASSKLNNKMPYKYIFVDEYQDFSLLFLTLIQSLRETCPRARLLTVGDDWQAINRFAGSDVEYFKHFEKYFDEDVKKLFIPTNYRSGKKIVKNANYFMSRALKDYNGCKSGNKIKASIYYVNVNYDEKAGHDDKTPLLIRNYYQIIQKIIKENPNKTVQILSRNNDLSFNDWSLNRFTEMLNTKLINDKIISIEQAGRLITNSTIHRSKGLESDIVVLLEIDAEKFPSKDKTHGLYKIFGDDETSLFLDEARLFYVAITRPKEKLFILSKTTKIRKNNRKLNFFSYLNSDWLEEYQTHLSSRSFSSEPSS